MDTYQTTFILNEKFTYIPKDERATSERVTHSLVFLYGAMIFFTLGMAKVLGESIDFLRLENLTLNEWRYMVYVCGVIGASHFISVIRRAREKRLFLSEVKDEIDNAKDELEQERVQTSALHAQINSLKRQLSALHNQDDQRTLQKKIKYKNDFIDELQKKLRKSEDEQEALSHEFEALKCENIYLENKLTEKLVQNDIQEEATTENKRAIDLYNRYLMPSSNKYLPRLDALFDVLEHMEKEKNLSPLDGKKFGFIESRNALGALAEEAPKIYKEKFKKEPPKTTLSAYVEITKLEK